jgi:exodeoxyribonuclease-3
MQTSNQHLRIVTWNIQQGGDMRREPLTAHLREWQPDICVLMEYGNTDASRWIRNRLEDDGLTHQVEAIDVKRYFEYGLLIAARWPLTPLDCSLEGLLPQRWRLLQVAGPLPFTLGSVHVTGRSERPGNKYQALQSLAALAQSWPYGAGLLMGDFNCGLPPLDEEMPYFNQREQAFMQQMSAAGWTDALRHLHPQQRSYSWWRKLEGQRSGLRTDHAWLNPALLPHLARCDLVGGIGTADTWPSDHAALLVDLQPVSPAP